MPDLDRNIWTGLVIVMFVIVANIYAFIAFRMKKWRSKIAADWRELLDDAQQRNGKLHKELSDLKATINYVEQTGGYDDETDWKIKKLNWENNVLKAELEKLKKLNMTLDSENNRLKIRLEVMQRNE